jgi:ribosomal-protein-alanine N-acetyltransferase
MKQSILETKRTFLRPFTLNDATNLYHLNFDQEVLKYTGDVPFENIEAARQFIENYDQYEKYGFGRWAVISKENQDFFGWCGLKYSPEIDEYDLGFRFFKKYWNMGYASETAKACLEIGLNKFKISLILGRAMKNNPSSIRVLEKIGMTYFKNFDFNGKEGVIYQITNSVPDTSVK